MNRLLFGLITIALLLAGGNGARAQFLNPEDLVETEVYLSLEQVQQGGAVKMALRVTLDDTWHVNSDKPNEDFLIPTTVTLENAEGVSIARTVYPEPHEYNFEFSDMPLSVFEGEFLVGVLLTIDEAKPAGVDTVVVSFNYQACNNAQCLAPVSVTDTIAISVVDPTAMVNEQHTDIFSQLDLSYSAVAETPEDGGDDDSVTSMLQESGLLLGLILVFIGGLALNLTPCVYPLIPITIGYFGGQAEGSTPRLAAMGLLYVLGLALTYSVIGVITALSGAVFGALLQNPVVILVIVGIFIALSLSMFGVYEFKLPDSVVAKAGSAKGGLYGAFFMGLTMGIVAAPCIGPFVLGLVTYVAAQADPVNGFLFFFFLALGLGTPYFVLAIFSGKIKKLPRSGVWMEAVKHVFGFILLGMAIYFLMPLLPDTIADYILPVFGIVAGLYLIFFEKKGNNVKGFRVFRIIFSVLVIALSVYSILPSDKQSIPWDPYTEPAYEQAVESGQPILIDFYADWCIPCKELDALTFSDPAVIERAAEFVSLKADMTSSLSPEVEALKERFSVVGVPTVLVIDRQGNEVARITGYMPADEFLQELKKAE